MNEMATGPLRCGQTSHLREAEEAIERAVLQHVRLHVRDSATRRRVHGPTVRVLHPQRVNARPALFKRPRVHSLSNRSASQRTVSADHHWKKGGSK